MAEKTEITVSSFPSRCPYCDEVVEYRDLKPGENELKCEHCKKLYIKIVEPIRDSFSEDDGK